jgi:5'-3' exonuclease
MTEKIERIALVDGAGIFRAAWHAGVDKELSFAFEVTIERLHKIEDAKYDRIVFAVDRPPYKRVTIYAEYKANRGAREPTMVEQYERLCDKVRAMGHCVWSVDGFEADDVIATATRLAGLEGIAVDIYSSDKDLLQLVSDPLGVRVISNTTGQVYDASAVLEKMGVRPRQVADLLAFMGDKSDNIPGCPKCGPKTAAAMLEHNDLEHIMAIVKEGGAPVGATNVVTANLAKYGKQVFQSKMLVTLWNDLELPWAELFDKGKKMAAEDYLDDSGFDVGAESDHHASLIPDEERVKKNNEQDMALGAPYPAKPSPTTAQLSRFAEEVRKHYPADSVEKLDVESARRVMRDVGMSEEKISELEADVEARKAVLASLKEEKQPAMIVPHKPDKAKTSRTSIS